MGNFVDHIAVLTTICFPKVTNYGASIFKTIAKESHMDNSIKVTLFNLLKSSFKAIERAKRTRGDRPISPGKPLSKSCMSKKALLFG